MAPQSRDSHPTPQNKVFVKKQQADTYNSGTDLLQETGSGTRTAAAAVAGDEGGRAHGRPASGHGAECRYRRRRQTGQHGHTGARMGRHPTHLFKGPPKHKTSRLISRSLTRRRKITQTSTCFHVFTLTSFSDD
jgi:hypothetical protein